MVVAKPQSYLKTLTSAPPHALQSGEGEGTFPRKSGEECAPSGVLLVDLMESRM